MRFKYILSALIPFALATCGAPLPAQAPQDVLQNTAIIESMK